MNFFISHRGNIDGSKTEMENHPSYIDNAILSGYDVEIDIRLIDDVLYLGHDTPQYKINEEWLNKRKDKLWIHCKNKESVEYFHSMTKYNWFWHENDLLTLTSKGYIWAYPGKQPIKNSIAVLPEKFDDDVKKCVGLCSDNILKYVNCNNG